jgi:hypothetical protein
MDRKAPANVLRQGAYGIPEQSYFVTPAAVKQYQRSIIQPVLEVLEPQKPPHHLKS